MLNVSQKLAETVTAIHQMQSSATMPPIPDEAWELKEIMERCVAAEAERDRLRLAIWPGLPPFVPTEECPQQNFYEAVVEGLRAEAKAE